MTESGLTEAVETLRVTRRILRAPDLDLLQSALLDLCRALGCEPVDADDPSALPIDVSVSGVEPILVRIKDPSRIPVVQRWLPGAVSDARFVANRFLGQRFLEERATMDSLTGLWNRHSATMALNRTDVGDCIAMLDLDFFKNVNDTRGHEMGDRVLVEFASHLKDSLRSPAIVGRLGGEEFIVILPSTTVRAATAALERTRSTWPATAPLPITFSAGIAPVRPDGSDTPGIPGQEALRRADQLLYRAKNEGRDQAVADDDE